MFTKSSKRVIFMIKNTKEAYEYSLLIEQGILAMNNNFKKGKKKKIIYDFNCKEYKELKEKYNVEKIAGSGTSYEKAKRLLNYFSPKLSHESNYDNHVHCNSLSLLEYSFNNPDHGINCLNKAKIFSELCLSIGIFARRVIILPYSPYDMDNHVVTEIYDEKMDKWIMMDPTTNGMFIDENKNPLSILGIRDNFSRNKFVTYISCNEKEQDIFKIQKKYLYENWYICKNLFRFMVDSYQGFGEKENGHTYLNFYPIGFSVKKWDIENAKYRLKQIEKNYPQFLESARINYKEVLNEREAPAHSIEFLYNQINI